MSVNPEVSVVIPAFNAEKTLGAQLEALARQAPAFEWELIVCDNGSTDGTAALVRDWIPRLPQLVLVDASARRGASAARNIGATSATGSFLLFCDADDIVADDWVAEMRDGLRSTGLVAGANDYLRLHSGRHFAISRSEDSLITMPYWPRFAAGASNNLGIATAVFREVGGFDESLSTGEDVDLCWRAQLAGYSLSRWPSAVAYIRKRRGLVGVFRQSYSYAVGHAVLRRKYGEQIDGYWHEGDASAPKVDPATVDRAASQRDRPLVVRLLRVLRPNGLADAAWRAGEWAARHASAR